MTTNPLADVDDGRAIVPPGREPRPLRWWREFGAPPRIMGLDIARALAVLGMVGAHIGEAPDFDLTRPETWGGIVHGRSSILFAVLAGVSIALMAGRTRIPDPERMPSLRLNLLGRGTAIFLIGLGLELFGTPIAIILTVYGFLYIAAIPFLRWRILPLLVTAGLLAVLGPPLLATVQMLTLGADGPGLSVTVFGAYPITVWMAFVLAGMAIGRMPLDHLRTAVWLLLAGVVISAAGYGLGAAGTALAPPLEPGGSLEQFGEPGMDILPDEDPGTGWGAYPELYASQLPEIMIVGQVVAVEPHTGGTAEILGSGGFAVVVIALCLLAARWARWALVPLAALGSMPLTAYSAQVVAIAVIAGPYEFINDAAAWGWFSLVFVVAATLWVMFFGRGPLERLVGRAAEVMASVPKR